MAAPQSQSNWLDIMMFQTEYIGQSLLLSHVSVYWRQTAHSLPQLWPLFLGIHPDAFQTFFARTKSVAMYVSMHMDLESKGKPYADAPGTTTFIDTLAPDFHRVKWLNVGLTGSWMPELLELGRRTTMGNLERVFMGRIPSMFFHIESEEGKAAYILDWDMPNVTFIECEGVVPEPILRPDTTPEILFFPAYKNSTPPLRVVPTSVTYSPGGLISEAAYVVYFADGSPHEISFSSSRWSSSRWSSSRRPW